MSDIVISGEGDTIDARDGWQTTYSATADGQKAEVYVTFGDDGNGVEAYCCLIGEYGRRTREFPIESSTLIALVHQFRKEQQRARERVRAEYDARYKRGAIPVIAGNTPRKAHQALIDNRQLTLIELLTFAYINTPISDTPTWDPERTIAYVSYWAGFHITLCALDGDLVRLVYAADGETMDQAEALAFFRAHWPTP